MIDNNSQKINDGVVTPSNFENKPKRRGTNISPIPIVSPDDAKIDPNIVSKKFIAESTKDFESNDDYEIDRIKKDAEEKGSPNSGGIIKPKHITIKADEEIDMSSKPKLEIVLEKKGRARSILFFLKPWYKRNFKLDGQNLQYFDGDVFKGDINLAGSSTREITKSEGDNMSFPFVIETSKETIFLNANTDEARKKCIEIFNFASDVANWAFEY